MSFSKPAMKRKVGDEHRQASPGLYLQPHPDSTSSLTQTLPPASPRLYLQPHPDSTSSLTRTTSSLTQTLPPASPGLYLQPHPDSSSSGPQVNLVWDPWFRVNENQGGR
ncbi:hypothetical protein NHX12_023650 [Muraenolepis orangiensis]|uniref:Uncharacterized protein n=1 Tax=Muraenolepis orangiensis TaxID=630683 RepID=A0A9Q0EKU2_9TELE|nr:hypothetical protein NHX12_023650 [Muraenolepis orangiensis]